MSRRTPQRTTSTRQFRGGRWSPTRQRAKPSTPPSLRTGRGSSSASRWTPREASSTGTDVTESGARWRCGRPTPPTSSLSTSRVPVRCSAKKKARGGSGRARRALPKGPSSMSRLPLAPVMRSRAGSAANPPARTAAGHLGRIGRGSHCGVPRRRHAGREGRNRLARRARGRRQSRLAGDHGSRWCPGPRRSGWSRGCARCPRPGWERDVQGRLPEEEGQGQSHLHGQGGSGYRRLGALAPGQGRAHRPPRHRPRHAAPRPLRPAPRALPAEYLRA